MMPLRIGILGAAKIAPKAVIRPAQQTLDFQIQAVAARDVSRAHAFAADHAIPYVADGYAALIDRDDIDLIYNALPPAAHREWTMRALDAGKAVLCEKPFALNAGEAGAMVARAAATGRPLIEAFHNRFHPVMMRAIAILAEGEIGVVRRIETVFDVEIGRRSGELRWLAAQGGGALMDLGCYCVHAMRSLLGEEPEGISAACEIEDGVDAATEAQLRFPGGALGLLRASMRPAPFQARLVVTGERGHLEISNFVAPHNGCRFTVTANGRTRHESTDGPTTYEAQLAHVGDVLLRGAHPLTGGEDAVANMTVIDAIYAAAGFTRS